MNGQPGIDRRAWLVGTARAMALAAWQARGQASVRTWRPRWAGDPFALGVASGQPRPDSVVLWTRLHDVALDPWLRATHAAGQVGAGDDPAVEVRFEVYADQSPRRLVQAGVLPARASRAFSVHAQVQGLEPGRVYHYRFLCGDAVSAVGRTRTAPLPQDDPARLRLALASCQHFEQGLFSAHREIASQDLDLVLFVGDYIYESSWQRPAVRSHGSAVPTDLAGYRARHALYKSDADLRAAHAAHPWILTWDDHEVVNDYAADQGPWWNDPAVFLRRRAAAYQAYFEHMPLRLPPDGASMRIHDHFSWGRLADLWTLDCRQYRSVHACADPLRGGGRPLIDCEALQDESRTMLGIDQERWIARELIASTTRTGPDQGWRVLAQASQISSSGLDTPLGRSIYSDGWDGYPRARERLLGMIHEARIPRVLALGGDVHRHVAARLRPRPNDERSPVVASEFVTSSISSRGASQALMERMRRSNPDVAHARGDERGYALVEFTRKGVSTRFRAARHPVLAGAQFHDQATFHVEPDRPGVLPA